MTNYEKEVKEAWNRWEDEWPKHAKKKIYYHGENSYSYECGHCSMPIDEKDCFCRWCGAKMDGEENG